jgi:hypothetical protein
MSKMFFDLQDPALAARFYSQPDVKEYGFPGFHFLPIKVGEDHP